MKVIKMKEVYVKDSLAVALIPVVEVDLTRRSMEVRTIWREAMQKLWEHVG